MAVISAGATEHDHGQWIDIRGPARRVNRLSNTVVPAMASLLGTVGTFFRPTILVR
jgi:hypothetical protein